MASPGSTTTQWPRLSRLFWPCTHQRHVPGCASSGSGSGMGQRAKRLLSGRSTAGVEIIRAWWRCGLCEHRWQSRVSGRTRGGGCPACSGRVAAPGRSVADLFPNLAAEWHPTKNDRSPENVRPGSVYRAWWVCRACGNQWCGPVGSRTDRRRRNECPRCVRRPKVPLVESHPEVVKLWHPLNAVSPEEVSASSARRVRWHCPVCCHEWTRSVATVVKHRVCPGCAGVEPAPGRSLADLNPALATDWSPGNDIGPTSITTRSVYRAIWRCSICAHEWPRRVDMRVRGAGCPNCRMAGRSRWECRIRHELVAVGVPVVHPYPPIRVVSRSPVMADIVVPDWAVVIECASFRYHSSPRVEKRDLVQSQSLEAAGWRVLRIREALPVLTESDVVVPLGASIHGVAFAAMRGLARLGLRVTRMDEYSRSGKEWASTEADAELFSCVRLPRVILPSESLLASAPDIAAEWDFERNHPLLPSEVKPGSGLKMWWKCSVCRHGWRTSPIRRTASGTGCPVCRGLVAGPGARNCLADAVPRLVAEWHPSLNDRAPEAVRPGSSYRAWWRCIAEGHIWRAVVYSRVRGQGMSILLRAS